MFQVGMHPKTPHGAFVFKDVTFSLPTEAG